MFTSLSILKANFVPNMFLSYCGMALSPSSKFLWCYLGLDLNGKII